MTISSQSLDLNNLPIKVQASIAFYLPKERANLFIISKHWIDVRSSCLTQYPSVRDVFVSNIFYGYLFKGEKIPSIFSEQKPELVSSLKLSRKYDDQALKLNNQKFLEILGKCSKITELDISGNWGIEKESLNFFPESLEVLKISSCNLSDEGLTIILKKCQNLMKLTISNNSRVDGEAFESAPQSLRILCWSKNLMDGRHIEKLKSLPNLVEFDVSWSEKLEKCFFKAFPDSIKVFKCIKCGLDNEDLKELASRPNLEELDISYNREINELPTESLRTSLKIHHEGMNFKSR